jgi:hypothetical protein
MPAGDGAGSLLLTVYTVRCESKVPLSLGDSEDAVAAGANEEGDAARTSAVLKTASGGGGELNKSGASGTDDGAREASGPTDFIGRTVKRSRVLRSSTRTSPSSSISAWYFASATPPRALVSPSSHERASTVTVAAVPPEGSGISTTQRMLSLVAVHGCEMGVSEPSSRRQGASEPSHRSARSRPSTGSYNLLAPRPA